MAIRPGVYNINNCHNNYAMMMYANEEDGTVLVCIDGTDSQTVSTTTLFPVKTGPGTNRYTIGSDTFKYNVGADSKNLDQRPCPFTTVENFEWSIEPAVARATRIHIPNMDAYWFLPDGPRYTNVSRICWRMNYRVDGLTLTDPDVQIYIEKDQGRPAEVWKMVWVKDN
ncbi:hypothetical protein AG1IA_05005 [Rhizoctonia solani AG-1 IA]|uniref:Uncharacterized protein n=1 Tax=Thanatephorus cucumeris (strain AG1-IA) TaxID=983506 RepID=L8WSK9_THACA|nr:hypothetical protein AG1IA_05005 [Rhizoctonia solani AG-1 IA]